MPLSFDDLLPQQGTPPAPAAPAPSGGMSFDDLVPSAATNTDTPPGKPPFTLMDTWPVKLARSLYNTAKLPGDVYQGNATVPQSANMPGGEQTGEIGRVTDLASLISPLSRAGGPAVTAPPTGMQLKNAAQSQYKEALKSPIELTPDALKAFRNQIESDFYNDGITDVHAPQTFKLLDRLSNPPNGATSVTPTNLRAIQKSFGVIKNKNRDDTERMVAGSVLNQLNSLMENLDKVPSAIKSGTAEDAAQFANNVKTANANYTAYKGDQAFSQRGLNAEYRTNASHSGMNLENNLRSQVASILSKPSLMRGMSDETVQALKDFNTGSRTENTMRLVGNLFGGGGGLGMLAAGGLGHALGIPIESIPAVGFALKSAANARAAREFGRIGDTIRNNSPLAQSGFINRLPASPLIGRGATLGMPMLGIYPPSLAQPAY